MLINSVTRTIFFNLFIDATFDRLKKAFQPVKIVSPKRFRIGEVYILIDNEERFRVGKYAFRGAFERTVKGKNTIWYEFVSLEEAGVMAIPEYFLSEFTFTETSDWTIAGTLDPFLYSDHLQELESLLGSVDP